MLTWRHGATLGPTIRRALMSHFHAVVWIDHNEAKIFHFNADAAEKLSLHAHHPKHADKHHTDENFFHAVAKAFADAGEVLITGPAHTKTALVKHIARHDAHLLSRIAGVESADHPSDGQILSHARHYFETHDHKTAQKV
jgi:stalled ribosome rescue protein Dom34